MNENLLDQVNQIRKETANELIASAYFSSIQDDPNLLLDALACAIFCCYKNQSRDESLTPEQIEVLIVLYTDVRSMQEKINHIVELSLKQIPVTGIAVPRVTEIYNLQ